MAGRRSVNDLLATARSRIQRLEPVEARKAVDRGALVIDTRCTEQRREIGVIPDSVHVPLSVLYGRLDPTSDSRDERLADPDRHVILVCAHGYSLSLAAATLADLGFASAGDVVGGFEAWRAAGLPVDPAPD